MPNTILVDFNQTIISNIAMHSKDYGGELDLGIIRHMVLNSLLSYRKKFSDYPDMVICCDGPDAWRRRSFPHYKAQRRKGAHESPLDWKMIYTAIDTISSELDSFFPYKVVKVKHAEGDDVIAVITKLLVGVDPKSGSGSHNAGSKVKIISSDKDFRQLQVFPGVSQYSSIQSKDIVESDPEKYLFESILRGDPGDGIPNFRSADDCFVMGIRQRAIYAKRVEEAWAIKDPIQFCSTEELQNYIRNKSMIDLVHSEIPEAIVDSILETYYAAHVAPRSGLLNYMTSKKLRNLVGELQYF